MFRHSALWKALDFHNPRPHIWHWLNCGPKCEYFICTEVPHNTEGRKGTGSDFVWGSWMYLISVEQGKTSSVILEIHI